MFVWKFHFEAEREGMKFFSLLIILVIFRTKQEKKKSIPDSHSYTPAVSVYVFFLLINMIIPCGSDKPSSLSALLFFSHSVVSDSFMTSWTACSPPGFSVHEICQTQILEWTAILFSTFNVSESEYLAEDVIFRNSKNLWRKDKMNLSSV